MGKICEREKFYGETQYGFRSGKSTTDCILLLQDTGLGIRLGRAIMNGIFFADDLILISKTAVRGITTLLNIVDRVFGDMHMKLEDSKIFVLTTGPGGKNLKIGSNGESLTEMLMVKYLGVNIQLRGKEPGRHRKGYDSYSKQICIQYIQYCQNGIGQK